VLKYYGAIYVNVLYLLVSGAPVYFSDAAFYLLVGVYLALVVLRVFLTYVYFNTVTGWWCKCSL
jgi:hypothetical protein